MKQITERMNMRIKALAAQAEAFLPAFCEDQPCDITCPYYVATDIMNNCECLKTYRAITSLAEKADISMVKG